MRFWRQLTTHTTHTLTDRRRSVDNKMESGNIFFDPSFNGNMLYLGNGGRMAMNMEETSKRRLYFGTPEEFCDNDQSPEKKRRLTSEQVQLLEKSFEVDNKLEPDRKTELAKKLSLQPRQVAVWFQNRRARWKTKQMERDYDLLKSSYDTLVSNFDSIVKENHKLKAELLSFTKKLHPEKTAEDQKPDPLAAEEPPCLQLIVKMEGHLSAGTVVDGADGTMHLDMMSNDSFFLNSEYHGCVEAAAVDGVISEEDDSSDDGGSYFSDVFAAAEPPEAVGWFIWS